ncbi:hypothetical protein IAU59_005169 [Kwoniella sp. CBS 9459]
MEHILSHLAGDRSALVAWCLTSQVFHQMGTPFLWRYLELSPWKSIEEGDHEVHVLDPKKTDLIRKIDHHVAKFPSWTKELLESVRIFNLREHSSEWCHTADSRAPLMLPNLQTLQLTASKPEWALPFDQDCDPTGSESEVESPWNQPPGSPCRLVAALRPTNVVIRDEMVVRSSPEHQSQCSDGYLVGEGNAESHPTVGIWSQVETLVLLYSAHDAQLSRWRSEICRPEMVPKLKHMYWIIDPTPLSPAERCSLNSRAEALKRNGALGELAGNFEDTPVTIVNFEAAWAYNINWSRVARYTQSNMLSHVLHLISRHLAHWPEARLETRLASIDFLKLDEYLGGESWRDIFDVAEMDRWKSYPRAGSSRPTVSRKVQS